MIVSLRDGLGMYEQYNDAQIMRNDMVVTGEQKALQIRLRHEHYRGEYHAGKAFAEDSFRRQAGVGGF